MRVLFDHQVFDSQTVEGPSRYFYELACHLIAEGVEVNFAVHQTDNVFLHGDPRWASQVIHHPKQKPLLARLRAMAVWAGIVPYMATFPKNQAASEAALRLGNFDIFHPTYYEPYFLALMNHTPYVVTVHDMIHELYPEYVKPGNPTTQWKRAVLEKAAAVIAVSECTKQDLMRLFSLAPDKISVVHHGVGKPFSNDVPLPRRGEGKGEGRGHYLLYLGGRDRYKNFKCLLLALPVLFNIYPELRLVCVGGGAFSISENERMQKLGVQKRITQTKANDEDLAQLYRGAAAFIFPSLYEGFGMPILEAMACGCPVVLSRASSFPEVAGDAAFYFDPKEPEDLARVAINLLASGDMQEKLRQSGRQRAAQFTWQKATQKTLAIYKSIAGVT